MYDEQILSRRLSMIESQIFVLHGQSVAKGLIKCEAGYFELPTELRSLPSPIWQVCHRLQHLVTEMSHKAYIISN